jgi:hypothetical protein
VLAASIAAGALAGCFGPSEGGPVTLGGDPGELCVPASPGQLVGVGEVVHGSAGSTIEAVSLVGAAGMESQDAYIVPILDRTSLGAMYPEEETSAAWRMREPAVGFEFDSDDAVNLVVTIQRQDAEEAAADGVRVDYENAGRDYFATGSTSYELADECG